MKKYFLHILLPLTAGVLIYILFRKPETILHKTISLSFAPIELPTNRFTQFFLFQFPDMCWAYALTSSILFGTTFNKYVCAAISVLALSLYELKQAGWLLANLNYSDIVSMILAVMIALLIIKK
ncbi:MAG: hypothetical protein ACKVOW_12385 [Chitinophagaceae bacterium]